MKKFIFLISFLIVLTSYSQSQPIIDSLHQELIIANETTDKIQILRLLAFELRYDAPEKAVFYAKKGLDLATGKLEANQIEFYYTLGRIYKIKNKKDSAKLVFLKSIELAKKYDKQLLAADSYLSLGIMYKNMSKQDTAMTYYKMAENLVKNVDSPKAHSALISIKINQANIIEYNDKHLAITTLKKVEQLCEQYAISKKLPDVYSNLANIFFAIHDFEQSLEYHRKALQFDIKINNERMFAYDYSMLSSSHLNLGNLDSCLFYAKKSLKLAKKDKDLDQLSYSELVLSGAYIENKIFDKAYIHATNALEFAQKLNNPEFELYCHINMATARLHQGPIHEVKIYLDKAMAFLNQNDIPNSRKEVYDIYMRYYYRTNNIDNALKYHNLRKKVQNKILIEEKRASIHTIEIKYETEKKEAKILKLNNENLRNEAKLYQSKLTIYAISVLSLIGFGLVYFYWNRKKQQQKLELLNSSIQASEEEKKRIGKELHDGIASSLIRLVHEVEDNNVDLSHKILTTYEEVRNLSHQLDNTPSHGEVFIERLMEIIPIEKENQIFTFKIEPTSLNIDEPFGTHIYRIIQELITNNLKYAKASKSTFGIFHQSESLTIKYTDNGVGITHLEKGNGLKNIEDRVKLMNGKLDLHIKQEKGFGLTINIPYEHINH